MSAEPVDAPTEVVREVADALAPLHGPGLAVRHPYVHGVRDRSRVEVRVYVPPRHPRDGDRALGMLQGHGFSPVRRLRGAESNICILLEIELDGGGDDDTPVDPDRAEQDTIA